MPQRLIYGSFDLTSEDENWPACPAHPFVRLMPVPASPLELACIFGCRTWLLIDDDEARRDMVAVWQEAFA